MKTVTLLNLDVSKHDATVSLNVRHIGLDKKRDECWVLSHDSDMPEVWYTNGTYFPSAGDVYSYVADLVNQAFTMFEAKGYTLYHVGLMKHWNDNDILTHVDYDIRLLFAMELYAIWQHVKETQWKLLSLSVWSEF